MDKRDIDLMNDEAFWRMNEETLNERESVTLRRVTPIRSLPVSMAGDRSTVTGDIVGDRPPIARGDDGKKKERVHHAA